MTRPAGILIALALAAAAVVAAQQQGEVRLPAIQFPVGQTPTPPPPGGGRGRPSPGGQFEGQLPPFMTLDRPRDPASLDRTRGRLYRRLGDASHHA